MRQSKVVARSPSSQGGVSRRHVANNSASKLPSSSRSNVVQRTSSSVTSREAVVGDLGGGGDNSTSGGPSSSALSGVAVDVEQSLLSIPSGGDDSIASYPLEIEQGGQRPLSGLLQILDSPTLRQGRIIVLVAAAIYGTNFPVVKMLDDSLPLSISATLRFGLAAGVVAAIVLGKEDDDVEPLVAKERVLAMNSGMEIGFWYCIGYIFQAEGLQTVAAGKVRMLDTLEPKSTYGMVRYHTLLMRTESTSLTEHLFYFLISQQSAFYNALAVVVVPILDAVFKSKVLNKQDIASILLACIGVGFLELGPTGDISFSPGDLLALGQTLFFGVGYWRLESESQKHPHNSARLTVGQLGAVAVGAAVYAVADLGIRNFPSIDEVTGWLGDPFIVGALIWTGLVSTAMALFLETVSLKVVSASELTLLMTTISVWGAGLGYVALGEVLTPSGMLGGALILAGCVLGNMQPPKPKFKSTLSLSSWDSVEDGR